MKTTSFLAMLACAVLMVVAPARGQTGPIVPAISSVPAVVQLGNSFLIEGSGFTTGSIVNFFIATAAGVVNAGPLIPTNILPTSFRVFAPFRVTQGEGVVGIQVVDTDQTHTVSGTVLALLQGYGPAGLPSLTGINGNGIDAESTNPSYAVANVKTVVVPGTTVTLQGTGFDTVGGVGVDLFCDCAGGKIGPIFLNPGNPGLSATSLSFSIPAGGPGTPNTGPGSFQVTNLTDGFKSAALSVPIGHQIEVDGVTQQGSSVTVDGAGFSNLTVINFFNLQGATVVNLGGLTAGGQPRIPLDSVSSTRLSFTLPAGVLSGPAYVQALNPPFVPFTSSGNGPGGVLTVN